MATILVVLLSGATPAADPPRFAITPHKAEDTIDVSIEKAQVVFTVRSPSGIGRSVIERRDENWPKSVMLRLHLKGMEDVRISNGTDLVGAAVGIRDGKPDVRPWKGKDQTPAGEKDPLRLDVRIVAGGAPIQLPLKNGYFEVTLPPSLTADNPKSLHVEWIDFYR